MFSMVVVQTRGGRRSRSTRTSRSHRALTSAVPPRPRSYKPQRRR